MLGLYLHIPFCKKICPYCDFCKSVSSINRQNDYTKALLEEMKLKKLNDYTFDTLYIGGGTPSSISKENLKSILSELSKYISLDKLKEFTIETNPNDIDDELIDLLKNYHINRISIGVQTFNPKLQKIIERFFDVEELNNIINKLNQSFSVNIDMIYAIPSQDLNDLNYDLECIKKLNIDHISYYSLILEEKTVFSHLVNKNKLKLVDEELELKMYKAICESLEEKGFIHYETSNFSKLGHSSIHNLIYWNCDEYISLGASGSSFYNNTRFTTTSNILDYINGIKQQKIILEESIVLDKRKQQEEEIILGLRKLEGINFLKFKNKYKESIFDVFPNIKKCLEDGLLKEKDDFIFIPKEYIYITNHIILKII